jgi:two-component system, LytTR family, response regulator
MEKLKSIIIDDEFHGRENLKNLLNSYCPEVEVIDSYESALKAKRSVLSKEPDVIFLDINMPVMNGFEFLKSFDEINFMTVFVTAYEEFGIQAVKSQAVDYLLKPIDIIELQRTVRNLLDIKKKNNHMVGSKINRNILIPVHHGFEVVCARDIIRFEGDDCYTKVITINNKVYTVSKTLKDFESVATDECFFRIHKSHIINLRYLKKFTNIDGGYVYMIDGAQLPLSRKIVHTFVKKIKQHPEVTNNES